MIINNQSRITSTIQSTSSQSDTQLKMLAQQKNLLMKQLESVKSSKGAPETKQERIKKIQENIQKIEEQMQQIQMAKAQSSFNPKKSESQISTNQIKNHSEDGDILTISQDSMLQLINADQSLKNSNTVGKIVQHIQGSIEVLEKEQKFNSSHSGGASNPEAKKIAKLKEQLGQAIIMQSSLLSDTEKTNESTANNDNTRSNAADPMLQDEKTIEENASTEIDSSIKLRGNDR